MTEIFFWARGRWRAKSQVEGPLSVKWYSFVVDAIPDRSFPWWLKTQGGALWICFFDLPTTLSGAGAFI